MQTDPQSTAVPSPAPDPESRAPRDPRELYPMTAPTTTVSERADAEVDPTFVRVLQEGAVKYNTFTSRPGYPSGMASLRTHLHVEVWVRNTTFAKNVWADIHVYTHDGKLAHSETLPLRYTRPAGDGAGPGADRTVDHGFAIESHAWRARAPTMQAAAAATQPGAGASPASTARSCTDRIPIPT